MLADQTEVPERQTPTGMISGLAQRRTFLAAETPSAARRHMTPDLTDRGIPLSVHLSKQLTGALLKGDGPKPLPVVLRAAARPTWR